MATPYEIETETLIQKVAIDLKNNIKLKKPDWASYIKTGSYKERQPDNEDWWWMRAASVLRHIYVDGPVGVQRLRVKYGGKKNRGVKPEKFIKGSGKIIRFILQEFDKLGFTEKKRGGRKITPKGQAYLDSISSKILAETNKQKNA